ncbi:hypothetical protein NHX12_028571 [Muraenolepis orangiensis]|uniref:Uncharacterized protein n=1 Tax=Muraenolepis orangiensis TaxID=630683 RepID=A0A9Q0EEA3_9TELE|nr:hypothetical protein NHX12_028571 [Muraenolepis orangiensis]
MPRGTRSEDRSSKPGAVITDPLKVGHHLRETRAEQPFRGQGALDEARPVTVRNCRVGQPHGAVAHCRPRHLPARRGGQRLAQLQDGTADHSDLFNLLLPERHLPNGQGGQGRGKEGHIVDRRSALCGTDVGAASCFCRRSGGSGFSLGRHPAPSQRSAAREDSRRGIPLASTVVQPSTLVNAMKVFTGAVSDDGSSVAAVRNGWMGGNRGHRVERRDEERGLKKSPSMSSALTLGSGGGMGMSLEAAALRIIPSKWLMKPLACPAPVVRGTG